MRDASPVRPRGRRRSLQRALARDALCPPTACAAPPRPAVMRFTLGSGRCINDSPPFAFIFPPTSPGGGDVDVAFVHRRYSGVGGVAHAPCGTLRAALASSPRLAFFPSISHEVSADSLAQPCALATATPPRQYNSVQRLLHLGLLVPATRLAPSAADPEGGARRDMAAQGAGQGDNGDCLAAQCGPDRR